MPDEPATGLAAAAPATTESEEMYLIHVAMAHEDGTEGPVPLRIVASALAVTPASANQMVKKLEAKDLVRYVPYRGVELTDAGRRVAARVLRGRRLWGVFLADRLGFSATEADVIACDLEHITTPEVAHRLAHLLGEPAAGPGGHPIPGPDGEITTVPELLLSECEVGDRVRVTAIEGSAATLGFLAAGGVAAGREVHVRGRTSAGSMLVDGADGESHLAADVVAVIRVRPVRR